MDEDDADINGYYSYWLYEFGDAGGFDTLIDRLEDKKLSIEYIHAVIEFAWYTSNHWNAEFFYSWVPKLILGAHKYVLELSDSELKEVSKRSMQKLHSSITQILVENEESFDYLFEVDDTFRLKLILKYFNSESFQKRLQGITDVNELIERLQKQRSKESPPQLRWLDGKKLAEWISQHQLLETVFGNRIHHETVRKSIEPFRLLSKYGLLTQSHLDLIYDSSLEKQETLLAAIYQVMESLTEDLRSKEVQYFVKKLAQFPVQKVEKEQFKLLCTFLKRVGEKEKDITGLEFLWKIARFSPLPELSESALHFLIISLNKQSLSVRENFKNQCIQNLKSGESALISMKLLQSMLTKVVTEEIQELERTHHIVDTFFAEFEGFKKNNRKTALDQNQFLIQLRERLGFFEWFLDSANINLESMIDRSWNSFVTESLGKSDRDVSLKWFQSLSSRIDSKSWGQLLEKIKNLDPESFTGDTFSCFMTFFMKENAEKGFVTPKPLIVHNFDLVGLDFLWKIVLKNRDPNVSRIAMVFLHSLHSSLSSTLESNRSQLHKLYLGNILKTVRSSSQGQNYDEETIHRCIDLLIYFTQDYESSLRDRDKSVSFAIYFKPSEEAESTNWKSNFPPSTLCSSFVNQVKERFNIESSKEFVVVCQRKQIPETNQSLRSLDFDLSDQPLKVFVRPPKDSDTISMQIEGGEEKNDHPSVSLTKDDELSGELFRLLESRNKEIVEKAWNLVSRLPILHSSLQKILNAQNMNELFSSSQTHYAILYNLRIIEEKAVAIPIDSEGGKLYEKFVVDGGVEALLNLLDGFEVRNRDDISLLSSIGKLVVQHVCEELLGENDRKTLIVNSRYPLHSQFICKLIRLVEQSLNQINNSGTKLQEEELHDALQYLDSIVIAFARTNLVQFSQFNETKMVPNYIKAMLIDNPDVKLRDLTQIYLIELVEYYQNLSQNPAERPSVILLRIFVKFLEEGMGTCEFFTVLKSLVRLAENDLPINFWKRLSEVCWFLLKEKGSLERSDSGETDLFLVGVIQLLKLLVEKHEEFKNIKPEELSNLASRLLFDVPTFEMCGDSSPPKCKTETARTAAFDLLLEFCRENLQNQQTMFDFYKNYSNLQYPVQKWNYDPKKKARSEVDYCGLKNLGCTCYMNSLVQQLYMIPQFRTGILGVPLDHGDGESFAMQLQCVFGQLQESLRVACNPESFTKVNKDYDGNPMDPMVQMDVDEYFNMFCEKLEESLKGSVQAKLTTNIWGGKLTTQLICIDCPHRYERDELFYTISLDIKNKRDIREALELYVKGEKLESDNAYFCEKCAQKRNTLKRTCIKTLPNTLFINLKRFEFDFDTMKKEKLNDYCEFPEFLNLEEFTSVGLNRKDEEEKQASKEENKNVGEDSSEESQLRRKEMEELKQRDSSYYEYQLSGILIHRGTSESGHYYSFIKERNVKNPKWIEFNDTFVRPFDFSNQLKEECFGGQEKKNSVSIEMIEKSRSAYSLIYERLIPQPSEKLKLEDAKVVMETARNSHSKLRIAWNCLIFVSRIRQRIALRRRRGNKAIASMNTNLLQWVWGDNQSFVMEKFRFGGDSIRFLTELFHMQRKENHTQLKEDNSTVWFAFEYWAQLVCRAKDKRNNLVYLKDYIKSEMEDRLDFLTDFVSYLTRPEHKNSLLKELLLESTQEDVRFEFADLLTHVFRVSYQNAQNMNENENVESGSFYDDLDENSRNLIDFIRGNEIMKFDEWTFHHFDAAMKVIHNFYLISPSHRDYIVDPNLNVLADLLEIFEADDNCNAKKAMKRIKLKRRSKCPDMWKPFAELLQDCVYHSITEKDKLNPPPTFPKNASPISLPFEFRKRLVSTWIVEKFLKEKLWMPFLNIYNHLAWNDEELSIFLIRLLFKCAIESNGMAFSSIFYVFGEFMTEDSNPLQEQKVQAGLILMSKWIKMERKITKKLKDVADYVKLTISDVEVAKKIYNQNKDFFKYLNEIE
eukprot:TRINITY_DN8887_c0_g2_i3.p1 TRINITY_DN8887_c0_g2~~TRINITY_DN8887_c0_g2_i3.p1  ORF type:complete len:1974 (+),score=754.24 TRINITY_DN8887_c0_g2_i3:584-6505(+)